MNPASMGPPRHVRLTVCVPLLAERTAVRGVLPAATVVPIGMGMRRAGRHANRISGSDGPVAVLGVAGGVAAHVRPGDVVVASEVRSEVGTFPCPYAPLLVAPLQRLGLRVHVGPVATLGGAWPWTSAAERHRLVASGALAVDLESGAVAAATQGRPFVAVRCVSDTADAPLLHPGIVKRGLTALRVLRRIAPVLQEWAEVVSA